MIRSTFVVFVNSLGLGGTEKAACRWARGLQDRGHTVNLITLRDGPRRAMLESVDIPIRAFSSEDVDGVAEFLHRSKPDAIHAHAPGFPCEGDILGKALRKLPRIPVVQTNIFGRLENPAENAWTDFRLFISWTSCVQAARRAFLPLNEKFFQRASVAVYPLDSDNGPSKEEISKFRLSHGIAEGDVLFGRFSRPEPNKWTNLPLEAFRLALRRHHALKLLLREPPPSVTDALRNASDRDRFVILPATADPRELRLTMASVDVVLHTSSIGESFGYGIAEPMNYGRPVITNSVPWGDQAQIELVRHGECGYVVSTPRTMADAILRMAANPATRQRMGASASKHIRSLTDPSTSLDRLEMALSAAIKNEPNPNRLSDLSTARNAAAYLDTHQLGSDWRERVAMAPFHYRVRFHQWRKSWTRHMI